MKQPDFDQPLFAVLLDMLVRTKREGWTWPIHFIVISCQSGAQWSGRFVMLNGKPEQVFAVPPDEAAPLEEPVRIILVNQESRILSAVPTPTGPVIEGVN